MKNNKGITLIALVVTIIVLLILAGVSIAMLTGQNGILNRASEASYKSKLQDAAETISFAATDAITTLYDNAYAKGTATAEDADVIKAVIKAYGDTTVDSSVSKSETPTYADGTPSYNVTLTSNNHTKKGTITKSGIEWKAVDVD